MAKRIKTLLLSCLSLVLCAMLVVAGSFALFTDTAKVATHLKAGTLNASLDRIALTTTKLNADGYLATVNEQTVQDAAVPFTDNTTENVFGLDADEVIVPCTVLEATMRISNDSDVAFTYWLEITADGSSELANQLKVTVTPQGGTATTQYLSQGLQIGSDTVAVGTVECGKSQTFTVKLEFENIAQPTTERDNDKAQGLNAGFDLVVHATQAVSEA